MRTEEVLKQELNKANEIHEAVEPLFLNNVLPDPLVREFKGKVEQYQNMYESVEMFKREAQTEDAREGLVNQQITILQKCQEFELEIAERVKEIINA